MEENHAQIKIKVHFKALYESTRIGGPHHKSIQPPSPSKKDTSDKSEADTRIQGPNDIPNHTKLQGNTKEQHQGPPTSCPKEGGPEGVPFGAGQPTGSPDPLLGPNRPIFDLQTPTALLILAPEGSTSEVDSRIHPWRAI